MKNFESLKNEMFGKDQSLSEKSMSKVFAGQALAATKTKGSKTKYSGHGDSDPHEGDSDGLARFF